MITKRTRKKKRTLYLSLYTSLIFICATSLSDSYGRELPKKSVKEFGAIANDGQNDAGALRKAMDYCRIHPRTILLFPPGVYNFRDEKAVDLMEGYFTGKANGNPQDSIFKPYYPYVKGLDFTNCHDITVEASGAVLLCEGWMEPVSLSNCKNVRIRGLTIDYNRKPNTEGVISNVENGSYIITVDSAYSLTPKMPLARFLFYNSLAHRLLPSEASFPRFTVLSSRQLQIFNTIPPSMSGNRVMVIHTFHFRPAILLLEAKNIVLENVTIHSQPGMGIVGHRSENISLNGLRVVPNAGLIASSNTDATHFTSCKGYINYINCQFEGHGDDAANIHNYYMMIQSPSSGTGYDLVLKGADWHAQVLDYPDVGDTMELVQRTTLAVVKHFIVKTRKTDIPGLRTRVTFNEPLPADIGNYYLINITRLPAVRITGCSVTSNRARGFLIKTRHVEIENNLIRECTGTGIHVGAEGGWHEGPASAYVRIRYNRILRCGSGAGNVGASGIVVNVGAPDETAPGLHKDILIEGNIIEGENSQQGILVSGAEDVVIRYNEIAGCAEPVKVTHSRRVKVLANPGIKDINVP